MATQHKSMPRRPIACSQLMACSPCRSREALTYQEAQPRISEQPELYLCPAGTVLAMQVPSRHDLPGGAVPHR